MKVISGTIFFFLIETLTITTDLPVALADDQKFKTSPAMNDGQKWKIAYYEGGTHIEYKKMFIALTRGLMELGWVEKTPLPEYIGESTQPLWQWLKDAAKSDYLEFLEDGYHSADWDEGKRPQVVAQLLSRLQASNDIDLLIAMGTVAGQDFANDQHSTPTLVFSSSDPIAAGIVKSAEDSGLNHVHATVNPTRYERQVRVFHDAVGFGKLGIMYEDSFNGRAYSGIGSVEKVAQERGFEIVRCHVVDEQVDDLQARDESCLSCFRKLAKEADAIYVTQNLGVNGKTIPELVRIAHDHRTPTFSQSDSSEVRYGFLLSLSQAEFKYIGDFYADVIAKTLNGAKPGQLSQVFEDPIKLAFNLKTAETIGFNISAGVMAATDEFYSEIEKPDF